MSPRLFAAAALALLAACAGYVDDRAAAALRDALPRILGPAARYDVRVAGSNADATAFDRVHVVGSRVARAHAPVVDRVELDLRGVAVDRQAKQITAVAAAADAEARVLAADLADELRRRWLDDPVVRLEPPDRIVVSGMPRLGDIALPIRGGAELRGRLVAQGTQLRLRIDGLRLGNAEAPALARGLAQQAVNPLLDVAGYPAGARIDSVDVDSDALVVRASGGSAVSRRPP